MQVTNSGAVTVTNSTTTPVVSIGTDAISTTHIANGQFELIKAKQDIPGEKQLFSAKNNCIWRKTIVSGEKQLFLTKNNCIRRKTIVSCEKTIVSGEKQLYLTKNNCFRRKTIVSDEK